MEAKFHDYDSNLPSDETINYLCPNLIHPTMKIIAIASTSLIVPALFQLIVGTLVLKKKVKLSFPIVSLISVLTSIVIPILLFYYIGYLGRQVNNHDGLWMVGLVFLSGIGLIVLLIIILIQWLVLKYWKPTVLPS